MAVISFRHLPGCKGAMRVNLLISPLWGRWPAGRGGRAWACCWRSKFHTPRLRRQDRRPVPRVAGKRPVAGRQGERRVEGDVRRGFRRRDAKPRTARPGHAGRKAKDAEEAASGRVRLARQLFRREDDRRGDLRRAVPAPENTAKRSPRSRSATACLPAWCWRSGAANPASAPPRFPTTRSRCLAPRRFSRPARTCSAPR